MTGDFVDGFAAGFAEARVRDRARVGTADAFPPEADYGVRVFGAGVSDGCGQAQDDLDRARIVPPVFMPRRLERLIELGREPLPDDVDLESGIGGFASPLPLFLSAFGSTRVGSGDLAVAASRQAGRLGIPMVIGENTVSVHGYRGASGAPSVILSRIRAYLEEAGEGRGGVVVQQSTEDADSEVWNLLYSDPAVQPLLASGRLGFELKVGQGAKPGLGGMTVLTRPEADRLADRFAVRDVLGPGSERVLRCASPGTFTEEIVRQQLHFMRNNYPRARTWIKFHPGRDIAEAAATAWSAGADAVTVDGAEGGTGWAPTAFLDHVGLPLGECLRRIGRPAGDLLVTGRMWEGTRIVRALALGAGAAGLGRAALIAVAEDPERGLVRLAECIALELRLLISALGKYSPSVLGPEDLWWPGSGVHDRQEALTG
ncbi:hypothetical protein ABH935_007741 [Catenulispora sp. GAS73]|uniref:glutamate synthase-related protein n=1 Tax=Catenulispora sp. GAS73 TaxID=3156269 RepID=UPI00351626C6